RNAGVLAGWSAGVPRLCSVRRRDAADPAAETAAFLRCLALFLAFICSAPAASNRANSPYDVLIRGGGVIVGTGAARRRADIAIKGDSIAQIGDLANATAKITIDASHQVVTPGFIDLLGHSEFSVMIDPSLEGKVRQGVTTEVTGEGHSPGPIDDAMAAEID